MVQSRDGLKRIQQIVRGLRDFARIDESELKEVDLNAGIANTVEIMRPLAIQQQVALEMDLDTLPPVTCYAAKINQVVLNLVANAIDASPPGSLVTVRSRPAAEGVQIDVDRRGLRHRPGHSRQDLRPLLHHQAGRQGNRPGPVDQLWHRPLARRAHRARFVPRQGLAVHDPSAAQGTARRRPTVRRRARARHGASDGSDGEAAKGFEEANSG